MIKWLHDGYNGLRSLCAAKWRYAEVIEIWCADISFVQGCNESSHTILVVIRGGLHNLDTINIAGDLIAIEAQLQVVPLQGSYAAHHSISQYELATNLYVFSGDISLRGRQ